MSRPSSGSLGGMKLRRQTVSGDVVSKSGWLLKQSGGKRVRMHWDRRYVVIKNGKVAYYKYAGDKRPQGEFDLGDVLDVRASGFEEDEGEVPAEQRLEVLTSGRRWVFAVEDASLKSGWVGAFLGTWNEEEDKAVVARLWVRSQRTWAMSWVGIEGDCIVRYKSSPSSEATHRFGPLKGCDPVAPAKWMFGRDLVSFVARTETEEMSFACTEPEREAWLAQIRASVAERVGGQLRRLCRREKVDAAAREEAEDAATCVLALDDISSELAYWVFEAALRRFYAPKASAVACARLAEIAARSADGQLNVVSALRRVGWGVVLARLRDVEESFRTLSDCDDGAEDAFSFASALVDLVATIATRPCSVKPTDVQRRLKIQTEMRAAGVLARLDTLRDRAAEIAEGPTARLVLSQEPKQRRRFTLFPSSSGGGAASDSPEPRRSARDGRLSLTPKIAAAQAIKAIFDEFDAQVLDDESRETQRLLDARCHLDALDAGVYADASAPREALQALVAALDRALVQASTDPERLKASPALKVLMGQDAAFFSDDAALLETAKPSELVVEDVVDVARPKSNWGTSHRSLPKAKAISAINRLFKANRAVHAFSITKPASSPTTAGPSEEETNEDQPPPESGGGGGGGESTEPVVDQEESTLDPRAALNNMIVARANPPDAEEEDAAATPDPRAALNKMIVARGKPPDAEEEDAAAAPDPRAALNKMIVARKAPPSGGEDAAAAAAAAPDPRAALNKMIVARKAPPSGGEDAAAAAPDPRAALNKMIVARKAPPSGGEDAAAAAPDPRAALNKMIGARKAPAAPPKVEDGGAVNSKVPAASSGGKDPYRVFRMRLQSCQDDDDRAGLAAMMAKDGLDPSKLGLSVPGKASKKASVPEKAAVPELGATPSVALKGFHWDTISDKATFESSFWAKETEIKSAARSAVVKALPLVESSFPAPSTKAPTVARKKPNEAVKEEAVIKAFEPERLQAVAFALRNLKSHQRGIDEPEAAALAVKSRLEADDAFFEDDEDEEDEEENERILEDMKLLEQAALPTNPDEDEAELERLRVAKKRETGSSKLQVEATYVLAVRERCPRLRPRLGVVRAKLTAATRIAEASERLNRREAVITAIEASTALRAVLRVALFVGNALNHSSKPRLAAGVRISGLEKLGSARATAPGETVANALDLVVRVARDFPPTADLAADLVRPLEATQNDEPVDDVLASLTADQKLASRLARQEDYSAPLDVFASSLKKHVEQLTRCRDRADAATNSLLVRFGENPKTCDARDWFANLLSFVKAFDRVWRTFEANDRAAKRAAREAAAKHRLALRRVNSKNADLLPEPSAALGAGGAHRPLAELSRRLPASPHDDTVVTEDDSEDTPPL
ncbi:hypothetical protein CTAYLR_005629 [Chrysophaeum taylorii]|uniref:Formin-like protein n=1 Tax=Chrysophaeum taylorii TaxID=2483200 RepID=A0AAD7UQC2_9STRA|nr:hypothetical protein CTAYLR_005629 [Chrysophaeum taylorii]